MKNDNIKETKEEMTTKECIIGLVILIVGISIIIGIAYGVISLLQSNADYSGNFYELKDDLVYYETKEEIIHDKYVKDDILFDNYDFVFERKNSNGERLTKSVSRDDYIRYSKGETYSWEVEKHYDNILIDKMKITVRHFPFVSKKIYSKTLYILKTKSEDGTIRFLRVNDDDYQRFKIGSECIARHFNSAKTLDSLLSGYTEVKIEK